MDSSQLGQTVLLCLVTLFMGLRIFTRWGLMKVMGVDDSLSIIAWVIYVARAMVLYIFHNTDSRMGGTQRTIIANWLMILLYTAGTWVIKLSFSVTLYRVVQTKPLSITIILLAVATSVITIFQFFWTLLLCRPISKLWTGAEGSCHNPATWGVSLLVHGSVLLAVDLALGLIIPILLLRKLQIRMVLRVSVAFTIAVGSLASIATVARLVYTDLLFDTPEVAGKLNMWMDVEFGVNIICTAAITFKPLLRRTGLLSTSGAEARSVSTYHDRAMRIRVQEEVAVWAEGRSESIVLEDQAFSKV